MVARARWLLLALLVIGGATGCATAFPKEVTQTADRSITLAALRADPVAYVGKRVILGGEILATRTKPGETEIEILGRKLRSDDTPDRTDRSDGRLLVKSAQFMDPAVFAQGRRVTVLGSVRSAEQRTVGDAPYIFPVLDLERIRLWPDVRVADYYYPYGPYGPYPWGGLYVYPSFRYHYWRRW
jgi:outer membrane lipoprotein